MKIQANDLRIGDVIRTDGGTTVPVRALTRGPVGIVTTNPDAPDQLDGRAWQWGEVVSRRDESTVEPSAELESLKLGEVDGRISATCPDPDHPTWLRAPDDTRGCPWCRVEELEQAAAWSDADHARWAGVHDLVDRAIEKGYTSIFTDELADALGPDPATEARRAAPRTTGPRYPLSVVLPGGRVRHFARLIGHGPAVTTLCRKRGTPTGDGEGRPWCRSCSNRPNPQDQRSGTA